MAHLIAKFRCWSCRLALCLLPTLCNATDLPAFQISDSGRLFTAKGSNTVGAALMPGLVEDYLRAKGLTNITRTHLDTENEMRVQGYHSNQPGAQPLYVDIAAHGSSTSFIGLANGSADLGMSSRPIKSNEITQLANLGDMTSFSAEKVIAIDGLAIIVHPAMTLEKLSITQVAQIFAGKMTNWKSLGGPDLPITVFARDDKSGTWDTFKNLVLTNGYPLSPKATRFESNDQLSRRVASLPGAIGFVGLASVNNAKALSIHDDGTEPLAPTTGTVATEDYLLSRRLFLYLKPESENAYLQEFIHFAQGPLGQQRVEQVGYISQNPTLVDPDLEDITHDAYLALVRDARRLSVNIRFKQGSADLDNKAQQDIQRLAQLMQNPTYAKDSLLLVGFGDAKNSDSRAKILSKLRATRVKAALYELGVSSAPVQGFGAIMPVASEDKVRNQRVEIWLK